MMVPLKDFQKGFDLGKITADTYKKASKLFSMQIVQTTQLLYATLICLFVFGSIHYGPRSDGSHVSSLIRVRSLCFDGKC